MFVNKSLMLDFELAIALKDKSIQMRSRLYESDMIDWPVSCDVMSAVCFQDDELLECNVCGDLQPNLTRMRTHKVIAHGHDSDMYGRIFYCDLCERVFRSRNGRRDHMVSAHGVAPSRRYRELPKRSVRRKEGGGFACHLCSVTHTTRAALRNHLVIIHREPLTSKEAMSRKRGRPSKKLEQEDEAE